jgi:Ca2+:H+ antiporter
VRKALTGSWLNVLLLAAPVSWVLREEDGGVWLFVAAALSLIPAAGLIGVATEHLARHAGPTLGGFLNATFGTAAELIIAIAALQSGHLEVVKASITGSIIGNLLLVFGASCFVGGLRHGTQRFDKRAAGSASVMLFLAVVALVMPATVDLVAFGSLKAHPRVIDQLSIATAFILLGIYGAGLIFTFREQRDPLRPRPAKGHRHPDDIAPRAAIGLLALATAFTAVQAELLVGALEPALGALGMSNLFAGVVVVALVGNAAEHYSAVSAALANEMTLALEISLGSSVQIALMVAPVLVLLSHVLGRPLSLVFNAFEITAIILSVLTTTLVAMDGESHWLEGLQLLGVYLILGIAFYLIPA